LAVAVDGSGVGVRVRVGVLGTGVAVRVGVRVLAGTCVGGRGGLGVLVGRRGGWLAEPIPYVAANQSHAIRESLVPNEYPVDSLDALCER
jgi:hypothetical protein